MSIVLTEVLRRRMEPGYRPMGRAFWAAGTAATLAGLAIFLAWAIPANLATEGELAREGLFNRGFLTRMVKPMQGHGGEGLVGYLLTLPIYVPFLLFDVFPWVLLAPGAFAALIRGRLAGGRERALMWGWTLPTFVIFTLTATKLPHYMLGLMPMLAIALAAVPIRYRAGGGDSAEAAARSLERAKRRFSPGDRDWIRGGAHFYAAIAGGLGLVLLVGPWLLRVDGQRAPGLIAAASATGLTVLAVAAIVVRLQLAERIRAAALTAGLGHAAVAVLLAVLVLPRVEATLKVSPEAAAAIRRHVPASAPVYISGYEEPSLVYYLDSPADMPVGKLSGGRAELEAFAERAGPAGLVISGKNWDRMLAEKPIPDRLDVAARYETLNYSAAGRRTAVLAVVRRPEGWEASDATAEGVASDRPGAGGEGG
jgi:4-amino-4-deoxy-L-arabinose transferase-like glycosyltransferase